LPPACAASACPALGSSPCCPSPGASSMLQAQRQGIQGRQGQERPCSCHGLGQCWQPAAPVSGTPTWPWTVRGRCVRLI
jgi:hypothetical protein